MSLKKTRENDIRDVLDRDGNIGTGMAEDLLGEVTDLRALLRECSDHLRLAQTYGWPGVTPTLKKIEAKLAYAV